MKKIDIRKKSVISFFWRHVKPYKWYYLVMLSAPLLSSFHPFLCNYSIQLLIDCIQQAEFLSYASLLLPIALFLGAQLGLEAIWRISNIAEWKSLPYVRRSILSESYDILQHHNYRFFQDKQSGHLISKTKGILDGYDKLWEEIHHGTFASILEVIVSLLSLTLVSMQLTLFLVCWCTVYILVMYFLCVRLNSFVQKETESKHHVIGAISDKIMNIASIFAFASKKREHRRLVRQLNEDFIPKQKKRYHYNFKVQIITGILYLIKFAFVLFYVVHLKIEGLISIGVLAFVINTIFDIADATWHATIELQGFSISIGELKSSLSILDTTPENVEQEEGVPLRIDQGKVTWQHVSFEYRKGEKIFDDLTLTINGGEKVGIVGYSGGGKTSLIRLLLRYFEPEKGGIYIDEQNIATVTLDSLRKQISFISQDTMLFHRSIMENIRYGNPEATHEEVIAACKQAYIYDDIKALPQGFDTTAGEQGGKLSGGQKQRIAIARALLKKTTILILDEATSALDSHTEKKIQDSLSHLIHHTQKTVIVIAHRLSTLQRMDRIIVMDDGKIAEEGTHETLIKSSNSLYKQLWEYQYLR